MIEILQNTDISTIWAKREIREQKKAMDLEPNFPKVSKIKWKKFVK